MNIKMNLPKIPKVDTKTAMLLGAGAVIALVGYSVLKGKNILSFNTNARAARQYFSGEVNYYPGLETIGPDVQTQTYLKHNVVPNQTNGFPPSVIKNAVNPIFRENLETA